MGRGYRWRAATVLCLIVAAFGGLVYRLYDIQVTSHSLYQAKADDQQLSRVVLKADRGTIYDRKGRTLATDLTTYTVFVDPASVTDSVELLERLPDEVPGLDRVRLRSALMSDSRFAVLARGLPDDRAARVRGLGLGGVGLIEESRRFYPNGPLAGQVLGFTGSDGRGLEGVERAWDSSLACRPGYRVVAVDAHRKGIAGTQDEVRPARQGESLRLSIDLVVQTIAEEELGRTVIEHKAASGTALVINPRTGDILAMANWPSFDPNSFQTSSASSWRNRTITDAPEPGSTFKIVALSAGIESGLVSSQTMVNCQGGVLRVGSRTLHDHHPYALLSVTDIAVKSSNIGAALIGQDLGMSRLHAAAKAFGFGSVTGCGLPGESAGVLRPLSVWDRYTLTSVPMGHEVQCTALQLATAYSTIANGGVLAPPRLVVETGDATALASGRRTPRRVISQATAREMVLMLEEVVKRGTGTEGQVPGYRIAGKTGTAQKLVGGVYSHDSFVSSFVGFGPLPAAQVLVWVSIDEPQGGYYGGKVAAPAVSKILARTFQYLGISPSVLASEEARRLGQG